MKNFPRKEKKKISTKPFYCPFTGPVKYKDGIKGLPKIVECPTCKRRLEPDIKTCTGGREDASWACCVTLSLRKHRMKK